MSHLKPFPYTREWIDVVAPKHDRDSCTDHDMANSGFGTYMHRCDRCALLYWEELGEMPANIRPVVRITWVLEG